MDNPTVSNDNDSPVSGINTIPTDITDDAGSGNDLDPLAHFTIGDNGEKLEFNTNDTISTSDHSTVGDYAEVKEPEPEEDEEEDAPAEEPQIAEVDHSSDFAITDPAKMDFVKTYTKEFDDLVASATHAVEAILDSIDNTVREHSNDIDIPEEAISFLDDKPKNNKVSKFDEAQSIVRTIMGKASDAKKQGEQAAMEASRIYDNIQQFKKDTKDEIASIRNRDEFGRPKDPALTVGVMGDNGVTGDIALGDNMMGTVAPGVDLSGMTGGANNDVSQNPATTADGLPVISRGL